MMSEITGWDALNLLIDARDFLGYTFNEDGHFVGRSRFDLRFSFNQNDDVGVSRVAFDDYTRLKFSVGTKAFVENLDTKIDATAAVVSVVDVVDVFHECCGHGGQIMTEFRKDTPLSQVLALNYYGCKASGSYYGFRYVKSVNGLEVIPTQQYYQQPHEIAA